MASPSAAGSRPPRVADKVAEYRRLVSETLAPLVAQREADVARVSEEMDDWEELGGNLDALRAHAAAHGGPAGDGKDLKMLTNVGAGYRMHARVAAGDVGAVFLHVGCGVYPQLTLPEAAAYVAAKRDALLAMRQRARDALVAVRTDLAVANAAVGALGGTGAGGGGDGEEDEDDNDR
jgi:prefoldin subunit 5